MPTPTSTDALRSKTTIRSDSPKRSNNVQNDLESALTSLTKAMNANTKTVVKAMNANTKAMVAAINSNATNVDTTEMAEAFKSNTKAMEAFSASMEDLSASINASLQKLVIKLETPAVNSGPFPIRSDPSGDCNDDAGQEQKRRKMFVPHQPQVRILRAEDAMMYLDEVKMVFGDQPQIYKEFLDIMKDVKMKQIDVPGVIKRVSSLFEGNRRLMLGFNIFLPDDHQIEIPIEKRGRPMDAPGKVADTAHICPDHRINM